MIHDSLQNLSERFMCSNVKYDSFYCSYLLVTLARPARARYLLDISEYLYGKSDVYFFTYCNSYDLLLIKCLKA